MTTTTTTTPPPSIIVDLQKDFGSKEKGLTHQTFLGASIRNFSIDAGFGDSTSNLSVSLVEDEYHKSDSTGLGLGVDVYHDGVADNFNPPAVGSPVYFKFGEKPITIDDAWIGRYNELYNTNTPAEKSLVFGGILQNYRRSESANGSPTYSVSVSDPREILSNCTLILNNYAGHTHDNKNLFNIYGFLEYNPSEELEQHLQLMLVSKNVLSKVTTTPPPLSPFPTTPPPNLPPINSVYTGDDTYRYLPFTFSILNHSDVFPITGTGFSRRCEQGMPWYRIRQAIKALMNYDGSLPEEYVRAGFGGVIDFRGFKYVIDFSGLPEEKISQMYFVNYDQIDMLSLLQELCDTISHDLIVSLMPVINDSNVDWLYNYNQYQLSIQRPELMIAGIIRLDTVDRSIPQNLSAVKTFIDQIRQNGIEVESTDLGYQLTNSVSDRFVVGAQRSDMYMFSRNKDRDEADVVKYNHGVTSFLQEKQSSQWKLETALKQQILPFYGFLGEKCVTIPRGWGPYQQILLDSSSLAAFGVGSYYIATEIELRHALVSFESWKSFLSRYDAKFLEKDNGSGGLSGANIPQKGGVQVRVHPINNDNFVVTVPRCVFDSEFSEIGENGEVRNHCAPPYGYPLYYKRLSNIGISNGMLEQFNLKAEVFKKSTVYTSWVNQVEGINKLKDNVPWDKLTDTERDSLRKLGIHPEDSKDKNLLNNLSFNVFTKMSQATGEVNDLMKTGLANAHKVYDFVRNVASNYLGTKFLVKIPKSCNNDFSNKLKINPVTGLVDNGPFGFRKGRLVEEDREQIPPPLTTVPPTTTLPPLINPPELRFTSFLEFEENILNLYKLAGQPFRAGQAIQSNFNPITEKWEFNYEVDTTGGYIDEEYYNEVFSDMLAPKDYSNVMKDERWSCYVRFDNSQYLDLSSVGKNNITQEKVGVNGGVPDLLDEIDNISTNNASMPSFSQIHGNYYQNNIDKAVAFVKCEVDPNFYMIPKFSKKDVVVHSREASVAFIPANLEKGDEGLTIVPVHRFYPEDSAIEYVTSMYDFDRYYESRTDNYLIDTSEHNLDSDHIYVVVTLPGKIVPTKEKRFVDSNLSGKHSSNAKIDTMLGRNVIVGLDGFDSPPPLKQIAPMEDMTRNVGARSFSHPELMLTFTSPSPVYPDFVAVPLRSKERCYGPWMSFRKPYDDGLVDSTTNFYLKENGEPDLQVGGKIEFSKDEQLAPWNYAGYDLMNEAGNLKIRNNNELFISEDGSISVPGIPFGVSVGSQLIQGAPLVTSMNINVGDSISTSVKMEMYSLSFGKLKQQKEDQISKLARDRQQIKDLLNKSVKSSAIKNAGSNHSFLKAQQWAETYSPQNESATVYDMIVSTVTENVEEEIFQPIILNPDDTEDSSQPRTKKIVSNFYHTASMQHKEYLKEAMDSVLDDNDYRDLMSRSTGTHMSDIFISYDEAPYNKYLPTVEYLNIEEIIKRTE